MPFSGGLRRRSEEARPATVADVSELIALTCGLPSAGPTVGAEVEWLVVDLADPARRPSVSELEQGLAGLSLPGGSRLTFEPGGQVELSSLPALSADEAQSGLLADIAVLRPALRARGLALLPAAHDSKRPPVRVSESPRYQAMERWFATGGWKSAPEMMCNTASIQVNIGCGPDPSATWRRAHALVPVLTAMFACSPGDGWASQRLRAWASLDPSRTETALASGDAIADWTQYALSALVIMRVQAGGTFETIEGGLSLREWLDSPPAGAAPLTMADVEVHLTTLFPPVRLKGWLEIRVIDMLPGDCWAVPLAVTTALLAPPSGAAEADFGWLHEVSGISWQHAARSGLESPALAAAATEALRLAHARLSEQDSNLASDVERFRAEQVAPRLLRAPVSRSHERR